jgi:hypothetical protein
MRPERDKRLAASEAQIDGLGAPLASADHADFERDLAPGKASLNARAWATAHQKGRIRGFTEALSLALGSRPHTRSPWLADGSGSGLLLVGTPVVAWGGRFDREVEAW